MVAVCFITAKSIKKENQAVTYNGLTMQDQTARFDSYEESVVIK